MDFFLRAKTIHGAWTVYRSFKILSKQMFVQKISMVSSDYMLTKGKSSKDVCNHNYTTDFIDTLCLPMIY